MVNFEFNVQTKIYFGKGAEENIGKYIEQFGKRVMIHFGSSYTKQSGLVDRISVYLKEAGLSYIEFGGVKSNPKLSLVREGIDICRRNQIDFILAVGGGSVIDSAKAIAIGVPYKGDVWDFFKGKATVENSIPVGSILTIPAAGSEVSNGSVITNEDGWYKRSVNHTLISPMFAVMNPEFSFTLQPYQRACGIADIMSHIMEHYFTYVNNTDVTDRLCEGTLKSIIENSRHVLKNPADYDASAEIMWAGAIAMNGILSAGRRGDWASHMIEHEISGIYDVVHGAGLSVVFPAWMRYVFENNTKRFVQFAVRVWDVDVSSHKSPEGIALEGINRMTAFFREIGLPVSLKDLNIPDERLEEMAVKATESGSVGNFMKLDKEAVLEIFKLAR